MALRRPGRPPLDTSGKSEPVCLKLAASDYDRLDRLAKQQRVSMQDVIRKKIGELLRDQRGGTL